MDRIFDAHYVPFDSNPSVGSADSSPCTGELFGRRVPELVRGRRDGAVRRRKKPHLIFVRCGFACLNWAYSPQCSQSSQAGKSLGS